MKIYVDSRQSCGKFSGILILTPTLDDIFTFLNIIKLVKFAQKTGKDNKEVTRSILKFTILSIKS